MKKIIAIGDIHGRTVWKNIVQQHLDADRIIFVGDYFDAPYEKRHLGFFGDLELENFNAILKFKLERPNQVVLLIGNHDYHYLPDVDTGGCSGFQPNMHPMFSKVLMKAVGLGAMQWIHQEDIFLFSHAGVTKSWMQLVGLDDVYAINNLETSKFDYNYEYDSSGFGESPYQTPIWVRPSSLNADKLDGLIQVVGHTPQHNGVNSIDGLHFIDCLHESKYLMLKDGNTYSMKHELS